MNYPAVNYHLESIICATMLTDWSLFVFNSFR